MFVVLDTNHFSELVGKSPAKERLTERLSISGVDTFTTIITCQEVCQGRDDGSQDRLDLYRP